ncbi:ribosome production factor 2 homolog [Chelonus insularis]|uniref:ribosome production factor 2 homolog n=1 Tax=Chelonus insularis TaxID=460826 RepID=UPI00158E9B8E|nr:ribosome production factor 2 homolog [Chelonus insularis]
MPVLQRIVKPTSHKGKKIILNKEPKLVEDLKETIFIKGNTASQYVNDAMKDLYTIKKPDGLILKKKNQIIPFEDVTPIERFCQKHNCPLFMFTSNNKKRPHNLVMGRTFEHTLLDMVEFGVENFKSVQEFKVEKIATGIKPILVFNGDDFECNQQYVKIKNLLVDMFQRESTQNIRLQGLEHVLSFTANDGKIYLRSYKVSFKKSGTRIPKVELTEVGPSMDLQIRRTKFASDDLFKQSCRKPKQLKEKKKKNITVDGQGSVLATIHVGAQNIRNIQTKRMKGLKRHSLENKKVEKRKAEDSSENPKQAKISSDKMDNE